MRKKTKSCSDACPVSAALAVLGGKWKLKILWVLSEQPYRFGELKRAIEGISEKILIQQLKQLADDGMILREQYPEIPPKVEYSLSIKGKSILPILKELSDWSVTHLQPPQHTSIEKPSSRQLTDLM